MSKLAIFVEGLTERMFVERLIREIADQRRFRVRVESAAGPRGVRRIRLVSEDQDSGQPCFILIRDCHGEMNVASDVRDQYENLAQSGYTAIIGLLDLFPKTILDVPTLLGATKSSLNFRMRTAPINVQWVLAIMEIEAWFLAEHSHFTAIHPDLTSERIQRDLGFDPSLDDMEVRRHPASDLHAAYSLVGLSYVKYHAEILRTITALDMVSIYANMHHVSQLRLLVDAVDSFVATCRSA